MSDLKGDLKPEARRHGNRAAGGVFFRSRLIGSSGTIEWAQPARLSNWWRLYLHLEAGEWYRKLLRTFLVGLKNKYIYLYTASLHLASSRCSSEKTRLWRSESVIVIDSSADDFLD